MTNPQSAIGVNLFGLQNRMFNYIQILEDFMSKLAFNEVASTLKIYMRVDLSLADLTFSSYKMPVERPQSRIQKTNILKRCLPLFS